MKTKLSIISPVHIGTGENVMAFEYKNKKGVLYHYSTNDIFKQLSSKILLDKNFLRNLKETKVAEENFSEKERINKQIQSNVNYNNIHSDYTLEYNFDEAPQNNVSPQIKNMKQPVIPGSSLKGALITSIYYDILKKNLKTIYNTDFDRFNLEKILNNIYPDPNTEDLNIIEFFKDFNSCILCSDIIFDEMIYMKTERSHVDGKGGNPPLPDVECINAHQSKTGNIIYLDKLKANYILNKYKSTPLKNLLSYLDYSKLVELSQNYFYDLISEEIEIDNKYGFYSEKNLLKALKTFRDEKSKNIFYMRLGKNTNYFFKSISYAIKKDNPSFYLKHFKEYFSPVKIKPNNGNRRQPIPKAENMPNTRTVYYDDIYICYPGLVKIEFINDN